MLIANKIKFLGCCVFIFSQQLAAQEVMVTGSQKPMPDKWIDKDTGHKIVRLTGKNNSPVSNWYFHNNPFFKQKAMKVIKWFLLIQPAMPDRFFCLFKTMQTEQVTTGASSKRLLVMSAPATREFIYQTGDTVYAGSIDIKKLKLLYIFPAGTKHSISNINADATMFAGKIGNEESVRYYRNIRKIASTLTVFMMRIC